MQQAATKAPTSPLPPATPQGAATNVVTPRQLTMADVHALEQRKSELSNQLNSAVDRRASVRRSLQNATGIDRTGLESRLSTLDQRIVRLEQDIDENGRQLASLDVGRLTSNTTPANSIGDRGDRIAQKMIPVGIVFTLFVLAPMAFSIARIFWKRGSLKTTTAADPEQAKRLERMEHAIDSIAIEVERVSEGQRFVTRILAEGQGAAAIASGAEAQRVQVPR
jgi:hypothetical protein